MRRIISEGETRNAFDRRTIILRVGLCMPRSIALKYVRSMSNSKYTSIWDKPRNSRICLITTPKAFSGPDLG
jgi:hypothetical protein